MQALRPHSGATQVVRGSLSGYDPAAVGAALADQQREEMVVSRMQHDPNMNMDEMDSLQESSIIQNASSLDEYESHKSLDVMGSEGEGLIKMLPSTPDGPATESTLTRPDVQSTSFHIRSEESAGLVGLICPHCRAMLPDVQTLKTHMNVCKSKGFQTNSGPQSKPKTHEDTNKGKIHIRLTMAHLFVFARLL